MLKHRFEFLRKFVLKSLDYACNSFYLLLQTSYLTICVQKGIAESLQRWYCLSRVQANVVIISIRKHAISYPRQLMSVRQNVNWFGIRKWQFFTSQLEPKRVFAKIRAWCRSRIIINWYSERMLVACSGHINEFRLFSTVQSVMRGALSVCDRT